MQSLPSGMNNVCFIEFFYNFVATETVQVLFPYLRHELRNNMKAFVRNDPQQSHQVLMLELPAHQTKSSQHHILPKLIKLSRTFTLTSSL